MYAWGKDFDLRIKPEPKQRWLSIPLYETKLGAMYCGDSAKVLRLDGFRTLQRKAQLVFTSPPFPLNTKKRYGNLQGEEYIEWFAGFAPLLRRFISTDGSIVVEIGNAWEPKRPVMSTVVLEALLRFLGRGGLRLCQEFIWYNPARLPSPVQWVNVERIRVKDAFTRIWWMSSVDRPKADNRRVLRGYSESMKKLIASGKYNSGMRPSQHNIGKHSFKTNNNGAIPPNVIDGDLACSIRHALTGSRGNNEPEPQFNSLLKGTNTRSFDPYLDYCRAHNIQLHPARMPPDLVEFFVRMVTDEGDLVLDPFGGSNTTGAAAERLGRRWVSVEADWTYATTSITRFDPSSVKATCRYVVVEDCSHATAASASSVRTPVVTS